MTPGVIYVMDTSGLLDLKRDLSQEPKEEKERVWKAVRERMDRGNVVFPVHVLWELKRHHHETEKDDWPYETVAAADPDKAMPFSDMDMTSEVRRVLASCSAVLDAKKASGADEADPWVVAMALKLVEDGERVVVVSDDRKDTVVKMSLRTACGIHGIGTISARAFAHQTAIRTSVAWK